MDAVQTVMIEENGRREIDIKRYAGFETIADEGPYKAVSRALEIIPRTLIQNCGANVVKQLTTLRAKHQQQANQFV